MQFLIVWFFLWGSVWANDFDKQIEQLITEQEPTAQIGIEVYSMRTKKIIYEKDAQKLFVPASCAKIVMSAAALDYLGAEDVFETQLIMKDELKGYLVGSGDPSLSLGDLEKLVLAFKGKELVIDSNVFEGPSMGPGWMWDETPDRWCVKMNGLNIEHNFIEGIVFDQPEILTAVIAGALFERRGDQVKVCLGKNDGKNLIQVHRSKNLGELLKVALKNSDNLYANCIFRKMGKSWRKSSEIVENFLKEKVGINPKELKIVDGSGESRYNLITPHQMVEVLKFMHGNRVFREGLAVSGVDGTLKNRMKDLLVWGKTGTMTGICCLCGYLMSKEEGELVVSIFVNNYVKEHQEIRTMIDQVCRILSK